jgi:hypothetical protein
MSVGTDEQRMAASRSRTDKSYWPGVVLTQCGFSGLRNRYDYERLDYQFQIQSALFRQDQSLRIPDSVPRLKPEVRRWIRHLWRQAMTPDEAAVSLLPHLLDRPVQIIYGPLARSPLANQKGSSAQKASSAESTAGANAWGCDEDFWKVFAPTRGKLPQIRHNGTYCSSRKYPFYLGFLNLSKGSNPFCSSKQFPILKEETPALSMNVLAFPRRQTVGEIMSVPFLGRVTPQYVRA